VARIRNEQGFGLVELLIAMTVMNIALMAIVAALTSGSVAVARAGKVTTAATVADAQMESYRAMTSKDIGLDLSSATVTALDATYKSDGTCFDVPSQTDCTQGGSPLTKKLTPPTGAAATSCTTINSWFPNTLPCKPSRTLSSSTTPASPDGKSYRLDTYISQLPATAPPPPPAVQTLSLRTRKQVTVVVRDGITGKVLARETSIFDCSTGITPNSTDC
jgi:type II secretory pathway pseudopilin PulG